MLQDLRDKLRNTGSRLTQVRIIIRICALSYRPFFQLKIDRKAAKHGRVSFRGSRKGLLAVYLPEQMIFLMVSSDKCQRVK